MPRSSKSVESKRRKKSGRGARNPGREAKIGSNSRRGAQFTPNTDLVLKKRLGIGNTALQNPAPVKIGREYGNHEKLEFARTTDLVRKKRKIGETAIENRAGIGPLGSQTKKSGKRRNKIGLKKRRSKIGQKSDLSVSGQKGAGIGPCDEKQYSQLGPSFLSANRERAEKITRVGQKNPSFTTRCEITNLRRNVARVISY